MLVKFLASLRLHTSLDGQVGRVDLGLPVFGGESDKLLLSSLLVLEFLKHDVDFLVHAGRPWRRARLHRPERLTHTGVYLRTGRRSFVPEAL